MNFVERDGTETSFTHTDKSLLVGVTYVASTNSPVRKRLTEVILRCKVPEERNRESCWVNDTRTHVSSSVTEGLMTLKFSEDFSEDFCEFYFHSLGLFIRDISTSNQKLFSKRIEDRS